MKDLIGIAICMGIVLTSFPSRAAAQTSVNPDISVVGMMRLFSHDDEARPEEEGELNLADPQMELYLTGYLNPYARAAATIAWHPGADAAVEEVYAVLERGLPGRLGLQVGKYRLPFGRLNPVHPHAYSFLRTPLPHAELFTHEGLRDMAIQASALLPTGDAYTELLGGLLKGDALEQHDHSDEESTEEGETGGEHDHDADVRRDLGGFLRLTTSLAASEHAELALGVTALNAVYGFAEHEGEEALLPAEDDHAEDPEQLRAWVAGIDAKYKWTPSRHTTLQLESEFLTRIEERAEGDDLVSNGAYAYVDYRFRQKYNLGVIGEWVSKEVHGHDTHGESEADDHDPITRDTVRFSLFAGWAPIEETSIVRLAGSWTEPDEEDGYWELMLQFLFSLGPHQPHNF